MADADDSDQSGKVSNKIFNGHNAFSSSNDFNMKASYFIENNSVTSERSVCTPSHTSEYPEDDRPQLDRQCSIVDGLLSEIYDRWHDHRHDSFDSDTFTEYSSTSEFFHGRRQSSFLEIGGRPLGYLHKANLQEYDVDQLRSLFSDISRHVNHMSSRLVKQLKRRERRMSKLQTNYDIVTAVIQASSLKRRIDTRMRFSVEPAGGDSAFNQWKDAMKAVARLPLGIPDEFRKKVWLSLAEQHIQDLKIDWDKTVKFAFNERSNPDDNKLGVQIVKDLHRTGCSGFSGEDNEAERAVLKRILLAYARWNKAVGYCQGFNVIAALLLEVMDRKEADALKVMIYLLDHVLPQGYFANNLRALSVDMAVFRDVLKIFPKLSRHLDYLQHAQDQSSGGCYEPPLTNVFTMQWFLTLFATCLPKSTVLRVWDSIMLDGSEILLRTGLVIWGKLSRRILSVSSADEFYTLMGDITQEMLEGNVLDADSIIKSIYSIAPFPLPQLTELREKYTYNIRPFTSATKKTLADGSVLPSDEDDLDDDDLENITCFTGFIPTNVGGGNRHKGLEGDQRSSSYADISSLGPGAYGMGPVDGSAGANVPAYMERMSTDISALKKQYTRLRQRQNQAHVIITSATAKHHAAKTRPIMPTIETPTAMNHLFLTKHNIKGRNRYVAAGPRIANIYPNLAPTALGTSQQKHRGKHVQPDKWIHKTLGQHASQTRPGHSCKVEQNPTESINNTVSTATDNTANKATDNTVNKATDNTVNNATDNTVNKATDNTANNLVKQSSEHTDNNSKTTEYNGTAVDRETPETTKVKHSEEVEVEIHENKMGNVENIEIDTNSERMEQSDKGGIQESQGQECAQDSVILVESGCELAKEDLTDGNPEIMAELYIPDTDNEDNGYALKDTDSEFVLKRQCSPLSHDDSGLGTSLNSPAVSSTEVSPQHVCQPLVVGDINSDVTDLLCLETVSLCSKINETWSTSEYASSCAADNCNNNAKSDKVSEGIDDTNGAIDVNFCAKGGASNDPSMVDNESDIDKQNTALDSVRSSCVNTADKLDTYDMKENFMVKVECCVDIKQCSSKVNEAGLESCQQANDKHDGLSVDQANTIKQGSWKGESDSFGGSGICRNRSKSHSISRLNSNHSTSSTISDADSMPEVFSPDSVSGLSSVQQYYLSKQSLASGSSKALESQVKKSHAPKKLYNPFPVKHVNQNRAKTGIKLGLYKQSTLEQYERNLKGHVVWGK